MDKDFLLEAGIQYEPSFQPPWKLMTLMPEHNANDAIFRSNSDQYSRFESAMSSMVSNPAVSNDIAAGKLGSEFSPAAVNPIMDQFMKGNLRNSLPMNPNLHLLASDPGFAERAAKFSCFGSRSFNGRTDQLELTSNKTETRFESPMVATGKIPRVSSSPALKIDRSPVGFEVNKNSDDEINVKLSRLSASAANSNEESSVSEQITTREPGFKNRKDSISRKRSSTTRKGEEAVDDAKRKKKIEQEDSKPPEPPKDYIHVRARRGQATDSHSLAERVRREKISERMKLLQNLVPNCNKVTGKALMLDEIINYVQSLQRQVEFLSMKLATVNPSLDFITDDIISKNINQSNGNSSQQVSKFYQENHQELFNESAQMTMLTQPVSVLAEHFPNFQGFDQDDLQSIVRMGFGENFDSDTSFLHMIADQPSNMKIEL